MELGGNEKRIRALFSELSAADQTIAPRFERVWRVAETTTPVTPFNKSIAVASAFAVAAACLIAVWLWSKSIQSSTQNAVNTIPQTIPAPAAPEQNKLASATGQPRPLRQREKHFVRQMPVQRAAEREATLLSNWQSPTEILMSSPTASVLNSLPQLDQSAKELKQFLPKNTEITKESNQ
jgi:HAMP domain-containing protein